MKRIIMYGDSILRGITYSSEQRRHRLCTGYKFPSLSELGYEVINHARMGATVERGAPLLDATLTQDICQGSVVLLEYGGNDCDYDWSAISADPSGIYLPKTPEDTFLQVYGQVIETARERGATVLLSSLIPIDAGRYLSVITHERSYDNILSWLGDASMLYRFHEHYNALVHTLARRYHCPLLDVREQFLLSHNYKKLIAEDGIHPTDEGHDLIEAAIRQYLLHGDTLCA